MLVKLGDDDSAAIASTVAAGGAYDARPGGMKQWIIAGTIAGVLTYAITGLLDSIFKRR